MALIFAPFLQRIWLCNKAPGIHSPQPPPTLDRQNSSAKSCLGNNGHTLILFPSILTPETYSIASGPCFLSNLALWMLKTVEYEPESSLRCIQTCFFRICFPNGLDIAMGDHPGDCYGDPRGDCYGDHPGDCYGGPRGDTLILCIHGRRV